MTSPGFTHLPDLAAERLGGRVVAANDEFFAPKENLLVAAEPVWIEGKYTDRGKWMDGWETRRRRDAGHDWCLVRLGLPGIVRGVVVDTRHFKGNFPESCTLDGGTEDGTDWVEIVPRTPLRGDEPNHFAVTSPLRFTHLRLNIHPDGGVARLRIHGEAVPDPRDLPTEIDLAAIGNGATIRGVSDAFFGVPQKLLWPGPSTHMGDGWETRRRRGPGHDWVDIALACEGEIRRVELDTSHFKGNAPGWGSIEVDGKQLLARTSLSPDTLHVFDTASMAVGPARLVRLNVFPDGGVARLRLWGEPTTVGRESLGLRWLNALPPQKAQETLLLACGSTEWARRMTQGRPYASPALLLDAAERAADALAREDWLQAFAAHPRLGDASGSRWSRQEQAGVAQAEGDGRERLRQANRRYEERFGHIFILCAMGLSAADMLAEIERRIGDDPATEIESAAREQRKITRLRLHKLLGVSP